MSCDRRCFDVASAHYAHDDCSTCPGADRGPGVDLRTGLMAAAKVMGDNQQNLKLEDRRYPLVEACGTCGYLAGAHSAGCPES